MMGEKTSNLKIRKTYPPVSEKTTYNFGNRSFVVEPIFKEDSTETLGTILLRLMKAESEKP